MTTMNILRRMSILVAAFALIAPRAVAADFVFSITEGVTYYPVSYTHLTLPTICSV